MTDEPPKQKDADAVAVWHRRAERYRALVLAHDLFEVLADGLLDRFEGAGTADALLDVGAGTGLVSARWIARAGARAGERAARLTATEPAPAMRALLVERLAPLGVTTERVLGARAEELGSLADRGELAPHDLVAASASLQLADTRASVASLARALAPGGRLAFNLWWHRVVQDAHRHRPDAHWRPALARALAEHDEAPTLARRTRRQRPDEAVDLDALVADARALGLEVRAVERREREVAGAFFVDFAALDEEFLGEVEPGRRAAVLERARELAPPCTVGWRELLFVRPGAATVERR